MIKPELLSPAGNFESLKMAVYAGATAVYFGAKNFNARAKAYNFGQDLTTAVTFAHMYGVKVYLTLNTIVENNEIDELIETINNAIESGVDAFIVQDFGVVNILKNCFKGVEIHASTQMAVNNYEGALKAKEMGITRVVLSRETSLEDIKLIKEKTNLEIEYFVQGALCVCLSGNCYLSSCLFGKSGNRGECLQPCRLPYKAFIKNQKIAEGYLLSAKDINMSERLKDLIDAGVDSFKIEGRLRRPAYVYATTKIYNQIINSNFQLEKNMQDDLKKAFNRGDYCPGYFNGNSNIIDSNIQGHKGIKIGEVISFNKGNKFNVVTIKSYKTIHKGDGLKFIKDGKEFASISAMDIKQIDKQTYKISTTSNIPSNCDVHLILDKQQEDEYLSSEVKLPLKFKLTANYGEPLKLEYSLTYGINSNKKIFRATVFAGVVDKAKNQALTFEDAKDSLQKLNDTNFYLDELEFVSNDAFLSKKQLNEIRRKAVENILYYFTNKKPAEINYNYLDNFNILYINNKNNYTIEIAEKYNSKADFFVVKPSNFNTFNYEKITHKNAYLYVPSFASYKDLEIIKNILKNNPNLGVYAQDIGALNLSNKIILGAKLNIKNIYAVKQLLNDKVKLIETSPEISLENFEYVCQHFTTPIIKSSFDNFELMTFVHCPIKTIYKNNCSSCKYCDDIVYQMQNGTKLKLNRYKLSTCYFSLTRIN